MSALRWRYTIPHWRRPMNYWLQCVRLAMESVTAARRYCWDRSPLTVSGWDGRRRCLSLCFARTFDLRWRLRGPVMFVEVI
jgi:hypothetical protein